MSLYDLKHSTFFIELHKTSTTPSSTIQCAGFELGKWRCGAMARHLMDWLPEYALTERDLHANHTEMYTKLRQAALRVYTTKNADKRGEVGEIALHAICRSHFGTTPISERVFYKSTPNDVIKSFDMVHAVIPATGPIEVWLGESKLYTDSAQAIGDAISSITDHLKSGFLEEQKSILGPQIPNTVPRYEELKKLFSDQESIDNLLGSAVFAVGIAATSAAAKKAKNADAAYLAGVISELSSMSTQLLASGLTKKIRIKLIYVPLVNKAKLVGEFDQRLKALQ